MCKSPFGVSAAVIRSFNHSVLYLFPQCPQFKHLVPAGHTGIWSGARGPAESVLCSAHL